MLTALIMAGGSGERFWPLSTPMKPKQLLSIFSNKSMIRETVDRIKPIITVDKIFITTNILQLNEIRKELPDIPEENIIVEPTFKDTAAAIGYGSLIIQKRFEELCNEIEIVVLASDHLIKNNELFRDIILKASKEASVNKTIVTLGIKPHKPETAYGYIEVFDDKLVELNKIYKVKKFREKPNKEIAERYFLSNKFLWNSGIFIFSIDTIFKNFNIYMPEHNKVLNKIRKKINKNNTGLNLSNEIKKDFEEFDKISIDFGIMEYSNNISVIPVEIGWNDIGSFTALSEIFIPDEFGNIAKDTDLIVHDSKNNIIIGKDCTISLLGVTDLVIIKNGNNILISHRERVQEIKKIVTKYNANSKKRCNK